MSLPLSLVRLRSVPLPARDLDIRSSAEIVSIRDNAGPTSNEKFEYELTSRLMEGRTRSEAAATTEKVASISVRSVPIKTKSEKHDASASTNTASISSLGPCWCISRLRNMSVSIAAAEYTLEVK